MRILGPSSLLLIWCLGSASDLALAQSPAANTSPPSTPAIPKITGQTTTAAGNEACAKCHEKIFASFSTTPMAQASGPAAQGFLPGEFSDKTSGVHYRVYLEKGISWLSFDREGETPLHGKRQLDYFIGSGHRGKTYVFSLEGFAFESPINFYSGAGAVAGGMWDMTPKYLGAKEVPLTLPTGSWCLGCHTSDAQVPQVGTENKYGAPLFAHGGITCERCHGGDLSHGTAIRKGTTADKNGSLADKGGSFANDVARAPIVNPAKLSPARRDAVCMQCHVEGNAAIEQPGRHLYEYRPGDDLSEFMRYYVLTGDGKEKVRAVSQFEALAQSRCKQATGDSMTCTTCHDPHSSRKPAERVAYYRAKCLMCHGDAFAAEHHVEEQDCTTCHMPRVEAVDVGHTQDSDHRILRVPSAPAAGAAQVYPQVSSLEAKLTRFPPAKKTDSSRDVALAWMTMAGKGSDVAFAQAEIFLPLALAQTPEDPELLAALGYSEQRRGLMKEAREHYEHALRVNPLLLDAAANLGLMEANAGNLDRATSLWKSAFARAPGKSSLGINLARALCLSGHEDEARTAIGRVLEFNPDMSTARGMLKQLDSGEVRCDAK